MSEDLTGEVLLNFRGKNRDETIKVGECFFPYNSIFFSYNGLFDLNLNFRKKNELDFKLKCGYCGSSVIT
jgi:hypothetical protein